MYITNIHKIQYKFVLCCRESFAFLLAERIHPREGSRRNTYACIHTRNVLINVSAQRELCKKSMANTEKRRMEHAHSKRTERERKREKEKRERGKRETERLKTKFGMLRRRERERYGREGEREREREEREREREERMQQCVRTSIETDRNVSCLAFKTTLLVARTAFTRITTMPSQRKVLNDGARVRS